MSMCCTLIYRVGGQLRGGGVVKPAARRGGGGRKAVANRASAAPLVAVGEWAWNTEYRIQSASKCCDRLLCVTNIWSLWQTAKLAGNCLNSAPGLQYLP